MPEVMPEVATAAGMGRTVAVSALGDVRAVLQYVPQFRGRLFVVLIEAGLLPEPAVAEGLLDLVALQDIGVKLVLGVLGGDLADLHDWTVECEMKVARSGARPGEPGVVEEVRAILGRGQAALVDASGGGPLDPAVVEFSVALGAAKLLALLDRGILVDGAPVPAVRAADAQALAAGGRVERADLLLAAAAACGRGIPRVHVLNGRRQGVLVDELFSSEGVGTMVHADAYREIRPLIEEDIPELLGMIGRVVRRSRLVPRSYEDIAARRGDYRVMSIDEHVVGCVALHEYPGSARAEVACLYVKQSHERLGYGRELVRHAEEWARAKGFPGVFALSNRAAGMFEHRLGYREAGLVELPESRRRQLAASGRDSRVFVKDW
jgi:amino-acid N-acetyltransferase